MHIRGVSGEPGGARAAVAQLGHHFVPAALEGVSERDRMVAARAVAGQELLVPEQV